MKKSVCFLLVLALCLSLLPATVFAATEIASGICGISGENLTWVLTNDGVLTISGEGAMTNYSFGGAPWYSNRSSITSVVIQEGVTSIGNYAFAYCNSMGSTTIPESVTGIGESAFWYCTSLQSITLPQTMISIADNSFQGCSNLGSITIPATVTSIGNNAFWLCSSLKGIWVSESNPNYSSDEHGVLFDKQKTTLLRCPGGITGAYELPTGVTGIGTYAFAHCRSLESITIPEGVTSVGDHSFLECSTLTNITIPETVTGIGESAFYGCSRITVITFQSSAPTIGENAFYNVTAVAYYPVGDATWTESVKQDYGGKLTWLVSTHEHEWVKQAVIAPTCTDQGYTIYICTLCNDSCADDYVHALGHDYQDGCCTRCKKVENSVSGTCGENLTWELTADGVLTISGTGAMTDYCERSAPWSSYLQISSVVIENGVTGIGDYAFWVCTNLQSVTLPDSLISIGDYAFYDCRRPTSITIPAGVTSIGDYAFYWCCNLNSITFPDSLTSIGSYAFYGCSKPTGITIPAGVTIIGSSAFGKCNSLTKVTFNGNAPAIGTDTFSSVTATAYYPANDSTWTESVKQNYGGTITWKFFSGNVNEVASGTCGTNLRWVLTDDGKLNISGEGTMTNYSYSGAPWDSYHSSITSVVIENGVTTIGDEAFSSCSNLKSITMPDGVTKIGDNAFYCCGILTGFELPESLISIGSQAFYLCTGFKNVTIPQKVTSIGDRAFCCCFNLERVTIPRSVTTIGSRAFGDCDNLQMIWVDEENQCYANDESGVLFNKDMTVLIQCPGGIEGEYYIADSVTASDTCAFSNCKKLNAIRTDAENEYFSSDAYGVLFNKDMTVLIQCPGGLEGEYTVPATVKRIDNCAFAGCYKLTVIFTGDAPEIADDVFENTTVTVEYPADNATWTSNKLKSYGGNVTWNAYSVTTSVPMYRLYNPNSGEHFYTGSAEERDNLKAAGWNYEGVAWNAPIAEGAPVYRLYNPNSGDHHYTMSAEERDNLVNVGWQYEGVAWNSAPTDHPDSMYLYRLYNPNADCGSHHYTGSTEEKATLESIGWIYEGIGWFGLVK